LSKPNFRSNFERSVACNLRKRGIKFKYEPFKMVYYLKKRGGYCRNCGSKDVTEKHYYTPDFVLGNGVIIEAKGRFTSAQRTKMREVVAANPDKDVRMLFMKNNWITKKKKHKYSDWCEKNGIKYAFMKVPKEWAKEDLSER